MSTHIQGHDADQHIVTLIDALNRNDYRAAEEALNGAAFVSHYCGTPSWMGMENLCHVCRQLLTVANKNNAKFNLVAIERANQYDPCQQN